MIISLRNIFNLEIGDGPEFPKRKIVLTSVTYSDIIFKSSKDDGSRKCRNWQTSKTKDLVSNALVWVQVPSSALVLKAQKRCKINGSGLLL